MRQSLFLILLLFATQLSYAQYEEPVFSEVVHKNNVGLNLTPAAVVLLGGQPVIARFSAIYKRQTAVNKKWRVFLDYEIRDRKDEDLSTASVSAFNDSLITYRMDYVNHFAYGGRIGMEWFKPDKRVTAIYGVDFMLGADVMERSSNYITYRKDTSCANCITEFYEFPRLYESSKVTSLLVGFDVSIGAKFQMSERVDAVLQFAPEFYVLVPIDEEYSSFEARADSPTTSIEMRLRGIEFYMHYYF